MRVLACLSALLLFAACTATVRPPSIEVKPVGIEVGGGFCPPGQAKKGRC
jgi:hypothetical protein